MEFGRYRILSQLGQGGMATVYLGEDPLLNRLVAIKVIQSHLSSNASLIERFTVEAKTIAALRHVNIVEIFDFGVQNDQQFLVMEYVDGQSLQMLCTAMDGKPMPDTVAAAAICQAAEGLTSAEKNNVVHRDIKPENLLFNSEGILKIADFGIAHIANEQSRTQTGAVLGSPNFMSPEQIEGVKPTHKTDIFSLGGVFYYCLTGKLPFAGASIPVTMRNICDKPHPSVAERNPTADPFLIQVVDTLLRKEPSSRGEGARWLANQLRGWLNRHEVVDIVEHMRAFIAGLGLEQRNTLIQAAGSISKLSRQGTGPGTTGGQRAGSGFPSKPVTASTGAAMAAPSGTQSYASAHPTTGAMGPSSRSPLVWVGAFLVVAVLILAGAVLWNTLGNKAEPAAVARGTPVPAVAPHAVAVPTEDSPAETDIRSVPKSTAQPEVRAAAQRPRPEPAPVVKPKAFSTHETPKHAQRPRPSEPTETPAPAPEASRMGFVLIKSAPPFAALTINGRPQGETPMSSWLEVPAGKCHVEIVHRLTPPFDTVIMISPGSRQEFKFRLDR